MEELWKDMSLASTPAALQYYSPPAASYRDRAAYLHQDYLRSPRTPLPHATHGALSLEFTYLGSSGIGSGHTAGPPSNSTSSGDDSLHLPVDPFAFSLPRNTSNSGRRVTAPVQASEVESGDRRQKRMIKNRESAARSRARKQAYNNELELELAQLRRENAMLIKRQEDFHARELAAQVPDRSTLQRCRSAPPP